MITFIICLVVLIVGNVFYGKFLEHKVKADSNRPTPVTRHKDGVDYVEMKPWKMYVVQFLNIAGLGPIFGAVMGAAFGPMAFLWIVLGNIFFGSMHDYISGMLSLRDDGCNTPTIVSRYLGRWSRPVLLVVTLFLLLATGVSFVVGPVGLLNALTLIDSRIWLAVILLYYIIATILPIDKIIGRIYPIFGAMLLIMAVSIGAVMFFRALSGDVQMTEITAESFNNFHSYPEKYPLVPMLFVIISCGALSGFHATQSPLMARCMTDEKQGKMVFHAAMMSEGIVALIWAAAAITYFGGADGLNARMDAGASTSLLVNEICNSWLGRVGAILAVIGIIVCPITTGDTAMRSCRLIIADALKIDQKPLSRRLLVAIPCFVLVYVLSKAKFENIWTFVGISNQMLATFMLWTIAVYFKTRGGMTYLVSAIPATFMTFVIVCFFIVAPRANGGLALDYNVGVISGIVAAITLFVFFITRKFGIKSIND